MNKLCLWCKHFYIQTESRGYETTPGTDWSMNCWKLHWQFDPETCDQDEYFRIIRTAQTCSDYEVDEKRTRANGG